jgi:hypothetical protein
MPLTAKMPLATALSLMKSRLCMRFPLQPRMCSVSTLGDISCSPSSGPGTSARVASTAKTMVSWRQWRGYTRPAQDPRRWTESGGGLAATQAVVGHVSVNQRWRSRRNRQHQVVAGRIDTEHECGAARPLQTHETPQLVLHTRRPLEPQVDAVCRPRPLHQALIGERPHSSTRARSSPPLSAQAIPGPAVTACCTAMINSFLRPRPPCPCPMTT